MLRHGAPLPPPDAKFAVPFASMMVEAADVGVTLTLHPGDRVVGMNLRAALSAHISGEPGHIQRVACGQGRAWLLLLLVPGVLCP